MRIEVIVPARNAAAMLPGCLKALDAQTAPPMRIHLAIGPSTDETALIAADAARRDPRIVIHDNLAGDRASGLNLAIAVVDPATEAIAMVDAQSRPAADYLERAADVMTASGAAVVGGPMHAEGQGVVGTAIAAALASPIGVGDSSFHFAGAARDVESVYLGVYRRDVLASVGPYDPTLLRTEDDDLNARIRASGGGIRLDPSIRSTYLGRASLGALFRQYRGYGYWKVALAAKRPDAVRLRHLVPAAFVAALVVAALVSVVRWAPAFPLVVVAYLAILLIAGLTRSGLSAPSRFAFPAAVATMHLGYGLGTWQAILTGRWRR
jgi:succinoglycan biosynthesis protein ExoA